MGGKYILEGHEVKKVVLIWNERQISYKIKICDEGSRRAEIIGDCGGVCKTYGTVCGTTWVSLHDVPDCYYLDQQNTKYDSSYWVEYNVPFNKEPIINKPDGVYFCKTTISKGKDNPRRLFYDYNHSEEELRKVVSLGCVKDTGKNYNICKFLNLHRDISDIYTISRYQCMFNSVPFELFSSGGNTWWEIYRCPKDIILRCPMCKNGKFKANGKNAQCTACNIVIGY